MLTVAQRRSQLETLHQSTTVPRPVSSGKRWTRPSASNDVSNNPQLPARNFYVSPSVVAKHVVATPSESKCPPAIKKTLTNITTNIILLLGQTGHGKSSVLNGIFNDYLADESTKLMSCTDQLGVWEGFWFGNEKLGKVTVIDTPGFLDSEGRDGKHISELVHFFEIFPKNKLCTVVITVPLTESRAKSTYGDMIDQVELLLGGHALQNQTMFVTTMENLMNPALPARIAQKKADWKNWLENRGIENLKLCNFIQSSPTTSLEPLRQFFTIAKPFTPVTSNKMEALLESNPGAPISEIINKVEAFNLLKTQTEAKIQQQLDELKEKEIQLQKAEELSERMQMQQEVLTAKIKETQQKIAEMPTTYIRIYSSGGGGGGGCNLL